MEYLEGLKKAGVVGMFIGPDPSTVLRLIISRKSDKGNEVSEIYDATRNELRIFAPYLEKIQSGELKIPKEFETSVTPKKEKKVEKYQIKIVKGRYIFSKEEKMILAQFIRSTEYSTPKDVWEAIKDSGRYLRGRNYALYLKEAYLSIGENRNDVKDDNLLRKEVKERLKIDGIHLPELKKNRKPSKNAPKIDQVDLIDKFVNVCKEFGLKKGDSIPQETMYEIGRKIIPSKMGAIDNFKTGNSQYHTLYQYASLKGYKKKQKKE